jgi:hypothetical protein
MRSRNESSGIRAPRRAEIASIAARPLRIILLEIDDYSRNVTTNIIFFAYLAYSNTPSAG